MNVFELASRLMAIAAEDPNIEVFIWDRELFRNADILEFDVELLDGKKVVILDVENE